MNDDDAERAVVQALEVGYRLIDTAEDYRNEVGVGRALKASGVPREELFVTTKFNKRWHSVEGARTAYEASSSKLGLDYIDLLLIHWPNPAQDRYVEAWKGLIALLDGGQVRAIGTSNFQAGTSAEVDRRDRRYAGRQPDPAQPAVDPAGGSRLPR
jgi:2,5-diketo-D-gluconate reductase A